MTTKHTPGPWGLSGANTVHGADCIVAFVGTADEEVRRFSGERQSADAHLIAAAPDLLEACEMLAEAQRLAAVGEDGFGAYVDAVDKARAAIKKAKGQSSSTDTARATE